MDVAVLGESAARRRALARWEPGAVVYRLDLHLAIRFATPSFVQAETARGAPLVAIEERLLAAPLSASEIADLGARDNALVLVTGGVAVAYDQKRALVEDPASWLAVDAFEVITARSVGGEPEPITGGAQQDADARVLLGIREGSDERKQFLDTLRGSATGTESGRGVARTFASWFAALLGLLVPFRSIEARAGEGASTGAPHALERATFAQRAAAWFKNVVARTLVLTRLAGRIGERHGRHLRAVLDMMDRGEYEEALRHAIPVGGISDAAARVALAAPRPRTSLAIRPKVTRARTSVPMADELQAYLRERYRGAFEALAAKGRSREAAFVLAELLHANEEAVSFLEELGEKRLAAELAEARGLAPGLVVRQWFIAGDMERAVSIARRSGTFADAVSRLERGSKEGADALRIAWAESLALSGEYAAAHEVAWAVASARPLARRWMDLAIQAGGVGAARALVRKLSLEPGALETVLPQVDDVLGDPQATIALSDALASSTEVNPALRAIARRGARASYRLAMTPAARKKTLGRLVACSADAALRADLPNSADVPVDLATRSAPLVHCLAGYSSVGAAPLDAVRLQNGRTLVAFGEGGVALLSREGRVVFHADQPAYALVVSDGGDRALALAPRGEAMRIARIDLLARRADHWQDACVSCVAANFDGVEWFVGQGEELLALDVQSDIRLRARWRVALGGSVAAVARSRNALMVGSGAGEVWRYDVPSMVLRSRTSAQFEGTVLSSAFSPSGICVALSRPPNDEGGSLQLALSRLGWPPYTTVRLPPNVGRLAVGEAWAVVSSEDGVSRIFDLAEFRERARVEWGTGLCRARVHGRMLTLINPSGGILHVDLASGETTSVRL